MMGQDEYQNEDPKAACRIFETGLAAFLEGEQRPEVLAHASECNSCGAVLGDLQQVITTSGLLGYQDPPARLWTNLRVALVSEGLFQDSVGFWQSWAAALTVFRHPAPVAAVACLALLSLAVVAPSRVSVDSGAKTMQEIGSVTAPAAPQSAAVSSDLEQTVRELQTIYQERAVEFRPGVKAAYQRSLNSLDASIEECRDSVRRQPANGLAREYLLAAYEQKAEVLQSALESEDH